MLRGEKGRIFKTRQFQSLLKKSGMTDSDLCAAVQEIQQGLIDADLGGHLCKKRIRLDGSGKPSGAIAISVMQEAGHCFFVLH